MPFVTCINTAEAELRFTLEGQNVENTLYFQHEVAPSPSDLATLGGILRDWWIAEMSPLLVTAIELREVYLSDLTSATGPVASVTAGLPITGSISEEPPPNNVAACISFRTASRGRSRRGRNYVCGFSNSAVFGNTLDGTWMASVIDAYSLLPGLVDAEGWVHVVASRFSGFTLVAGKKVPTPRATGVMTAITNYLFTDDSSDSMRNRLPNH